MKRLRLLATIVLPSMFVGGLLLGNRSSNASTGDGLGYWPAANDSAPVLVAERDKKQPQDRWASPPPPPPGAPTPPVPPRRGKHGGVSVSIHGDHIQITGIQELVAEHLDSVREMLRKNPRIPQNVRDKIVARMDRVQQIVESRLRNVKTTDLDKLESQLEDMGKELEKALQGLDEELAQIGDETGKDLAKQMKSLTKQRIFKRPDPDDNDNDNDNDSDNDNDNDNDDEASNEPDIPVEIEDLKDFTLKPAQRDAIARLHNQASAQVAVAKKQLDDASRKLENALGDPRTSDADVVRLVDLISGQEAAIRKAKLLAWVQARRVLDSDQVKKLEAATRHKNK